MEQNSRRIFSKREKKVKNLGTILDILAAVETNKVEDYDGQENYLCNVLYRYYLIQTELEQ